MIHLFFKIIRYLPLARGHCVYIIINDSEKSPCKSVVLEDRRGWEGREAQSSDDTFVNERGHDMATIY